MLSTKLEPVYDVGQVARLEQEIAASGTSLAQLMERAGASVAQVVRERVPSNARVLVLCGSGNNGGDGWVAARVLARAGYRVFVLSKREPGGISAEPAHDAALETLATAHDDACSLDIRIAPEPEEVASLVRGADAVVDAILGTGFAGNSVRAPYDAWIRCANEDRPASSLAISADVPSGLSAQSGACAEPTFRADVTVTMLAAKPGLLAEGSDALTGTVCLADLDIPAAERILH